MLAGSSIVCGVVFVADADAFRRFDEAERYRIVYYTRDFLLALRSEVTDAQLLPMDGIIFAPLAVLVSRNVDAVYSFRGVVHSLAFKHILLP